jgi:hypothetical protein
MEIDVVIWSTTKTKGLEPNDINMEVDDQQQKQKA